MKSHQIWRNTILEAATEMNNKKFVCFFAMVLMFSNPSNKRGLFEDLEIFNFPFSKKTNEYVKKKNYFATLKIFFYAK